ncbi:MAG: 2-amino-4-hydroxy-6-hydroxymethyldihydropteridine diphosphokinase [Rudaea sp.]
MAIAYIGLGSNLADPRAQIEAALTAIAAIRETRVLARSRLYTSVPWGKTDQPDFVNAVTKLDTTLPARALLDELLAIERRAGRQRSADRWGPRILDLDILLYGECIFDEPALRIPHPHLHERAFVLVPLNEIARDLEVPGRGKVLDLLERIDTSACVPLESGVATPQ